MVGQSDLEPIMIPTFIAISSKRCVAGIIDGYYSHLADGFKTILQENIIRQAELALEFWAVLGANYATGR